MNTRNQFSRIITWAVASVAAILFSLVLTSPAQAGSTGGATSYVVAPPSGELPRCGDSIYLSSIHHYPGPEGLDLYSFKVVGVDLRRWLGRGGYGTIDIYVHALNHLGHAGEWNASAQSGARTGTMYVDWIQGTPHPYVLVYVRDSHGRAKCYEKDYIR